MENCVFIDIFTTQNDLFGKNNCPIQFCCEIFNNDEVFDGKTFLNPTRKKIFNIIPDEEIMIPGYITSGFNNDDVNTPDYNGVELTEALRIVHKLLTSFRERNFYIIGYNHITYDLEILNKSFKRVLNVEPVVFDSEHLIDVMKLSEMMIPVTEIGSYTMESVYTYLKKDHLRFQEFKYSKSTATDIRITKIIFSHLIKEYTKFSDIVNLINSPRDVKIFNFGKYKGADIEYVFENDKQYCSWLMKHKDIVKQNKHLIEKIKMLYNTID